MTVLDLIKLSMLDIGSLPSGQTPSTEEQADGLATANQILSSWSRIGRHVYTHTVGSFTLAPSLSAYTFGSGGTWNVLSRPVGVAAGALAYSGNFQSGVEVMPMDKYLKSIQNGQGATAALPSRMGVDEAAPLRNVQVFPTPNIVAYIQVPYWLALTEFASVATVISFPVAGYEAALRAELAVKLAPMFGRPVSTELAAIYQSAMQRISGENPLIETAPAQPVQQQQ